MDPTILKRLSAWRKSPLLFVVECLKATPSNQQAEALKKFEATRRMSIRSGHGCHSKGTRVSLYPYGTKAVEDITTTDLLMGDDSTPRKVLKLYTGKEEMARIKYHDNTYYDVNLSHKLALICTGNKCGFVTGDKIIVTVREYLQMIAERPSLKGRFACYKAAVEYTEKPVTIPPYILGMWLGDGTSSLMELTSIDEELITIWRDFGELNGLEMKTYKGKNHRLSGDNGAMLNRFRAYNLLSNKHIPNDYLYNSMEKRLELLAGLIDTDGYADKRRGLQFQIIQKNERLARSIQVLAQSCGMHAVLQEKKKSWTWKGVKKQGTYFEVRISRNTTKVPTVLKRKRKVEKTPEQRKNLHFGFKVERLPEDTYYGFELSGNHLYLLSDFTVTHNTGKDTFASWVILWFSSTRTFPKVACTAPTARQLDDVLWSELSRWIRQSLLKDEFVIQKAKIFHKDYPKEWWIRAISPNVRGSKEEQAETLAGLHGDHFLTVVDEASGVPDPVFIPLEGIMTQEDNRILLIGNPTKSNGYFHDSQYHPVMKDKWERLHWDCRDSNRVAKSYIDYMAQKYGEDSNVFRIRVIGEPPLDDSRAFIPLSWAISCIGNEIEVDPEWPTYLSIDVARYGDDKSIIMPRCGNKILPWDSFQGMGTTELAQHITRSYYDNDASGVGVDAIGVGGGVVDWLRHDPRGLDQRRVYEVNSYDASSNNAKWRRLRDELYDRVRDNCQHARYSFPDITIKVAGSDVHIGHELANELATLKYDFDNKGALQLESKKDMLHRGVVSPNLADSVAISEFFSNGRAISLWSRDIKKKAKMASDLRYGMIGNGSLGKDAWMVC